MSRPKTPEHCSFCGCPGELVVGPAAQICEPCAVLATSMFIVAARDGLSFSKDYSSIQRRAFSDYSRIEGVPPKEWRA